MEHLEQDIKHIRETLDTQGEILARLSNALTGDKEFGTKGLAQICQENSDYIEKDKLAKARMAGIASVISIVGATITTLFIKIFGK
jgi:hypothetical protein